MVDFYFVKNISILDKNKIFLIIVILIFSGIFCFEILLLVVSIQKMKEMFLEAKKKKIVALLISNYLNNYLEILQQRHNFTNSPSSLTD
jgi:hypothetical protein